MFIQENKFILIKASPIYIQKSKDKIKAEKYTTKLKYFKARLIKILLNFVTFYPQTVTEIQHFIYKQILKNYSYMSLITIFDYIIVLQILSTAYTILFCIPRISLICLFYITSTVYKWKKCSITFNENL